MQAVRRCKRKTGHSYAYKCTKYLLQISLGYSIERVLKRAEVISRKSFITIKSVRKYTVLNSSTNTWRRRAQHTCNISCRAPQISGRLVNMLLTRIFGLSECFTPASYFTNYPLAIQEQITRQIIAYPFLFLFQPSRQQKNKWLTSKT